MELIEKQNVRKTTYYQNERGEVVAKACRECGEMKPLVAYSDHPSELGGKHPHCRTCRQKYEASPRGKATSFLRRQKFRIKATEAELGIQVSDNLQIYDVAMIQGAEECIYCGKDLEPGEVTIDHVIPLRSHGANDYKNLVPCCKACNTRKSSKRLYDFLLEYCNEYQIKQVVFTLAQRHGIPYAEMLEQIQAEAKEEVQAN